MATSKKKKPNGTLPLLIGAIGFGIAAALLSILYLKAKESALIASLTGAEEAMVTVVVANMDLPRGTTVGDGLFAPRDVPTEYVHSDVVYPYEYDSYVGRSLSADLAYGKPLLKSFLDDDFPIDFSDSIPAGRRAMTVTVDEINSIAGFVRPGNSIDILVNIPYSQSGFDPKLYTVGIYSELPGGVDISSVGDNVTGIINQFSEDEATELLNNLAPGDVIIPVLQNIRVLATGKDPYIDSLDSLRQPQFTSDTNFTSVTLDVSPEQAALLAAAQDKGELLSLLRNRNDESGADFTSVSARDLFTNASKMAAAEKARAARASVASGTDIAGNLVDANGKRLASRDQLAKAGFTRNENGQLVDKNGNVVDPGDIVVAPDGTVMTKQQLAAAGLSVNENGQIVDKSGNIVSANDVVVSADGKIMTKQQLAAAGLRVNENGEIVDSKGRIVSADDITVASDGSVISKQQLAATGMTEVSGVDASGNLLDASGKTLASREQLEAAGYTVNESGQIIDKDGKVVDPSEIVVSKDGKVMSKEQFAQAGFSVNENGQMVDKNGNVISADDVVVTKDGKVLSKQQLAAAGLTVASGVDASGNLVDADGNTLMSKEQLAAAGYTVNENGEIVDKDGNIVNPSEIIVDKNGNIVAAEDMVVAADGSVMTREQLAKAGLRINENGEIVDENGNVVSTDELVVAADGSVMTQSQLTEAGLSINANGEIVDQNGNVVEKDDLITSADGTVLSKKALASAGLSVASGIDKSGNLVDANGNTLLSKEQLAAAGYTVNEKGQILDKDGNIVEPESIIVDSDGKILSSEDIAQVAQSQVITGTSRPSGRYDFIIGGASEDGVAKTQAIAIPD